MILSDLINTLDFDQQINISFKNKEMYDGPAREYKEIRYNDKNLSNCKVKVIWFSRVYNRIMIEL